MKTTHTNHLLRIVALSVTLLSAGTAAAQGTTTAKANDDGWVPVKHLEFLPDDVEGGLMGPEGEPIISVQRASHPSLIEIRTGFEAEIVKTMENM